MKWCYWVGSAALLGLVALAGCEEGFPDAGTKQASAPADKAAADTGPQAALAVLSPEDRALVQAQRLCPVTGEALGGMGTPVKVTVKGQPVFLCCDGCTKKAMRDPDKTLAEVQKLKSEAKDAPVNSK